MQQQVPNKDGVVKDEISLKEMILHMRVWWKYIRSKWKIILIAGIVGGLLGLTYSLLTAPKYKAEAIFVLEKAEGGISSYANIAAKLGLNIDNEGGGQGLFSDAGNIITFLKSRTIVSKTLLSNSNNNTDELLIDRYIKVYELKDKWDDQRLQTIDFKNYDSRPSLLKDSIITLLHKKILKENLTVMKPPDLDGSIISVTTVSLDETFSKVFTEKLIMNAMEFYTNTITKKAKNHLMILEHQADSIINIINKNITNVAANTDAIPNLNPAYQRLKVPTKKNLISIELNQSILGGLVANIEIAKINIRKETPLFQIIDSPVLPLEKQKMGKLMSVLLGGIMGLFLSVVLCSIQLFLLKVLNS